jgi:hypothetical protein
MFGFTNVILGYLLSIFRYGEAANIFGMIGSILILIGLYLVFNNDILNDDDNNMKYIIDIDKILRL